MDAARRKRRDFIQNITIVLLSLLAVALFTQTQLYNLEDNGGYFRQNTALPSSASPAPEALTDVAAPVRVAVTGAYPYGRYANISLTTKSDDFAPLGTLLGEALGTADSFAASTSQAFLKALSGVSIYYDFLSPLPLSTVAGLVGAALPDSAATVRHLVLFPHDDGTVGLSLWDGGETYLTCTISVPAADIADTVGRYELGTAAFAFDDWNGEAPVNGLSPCSLFLLEQPEYSVLSASDPLSSTDWLLTALGFNPHTNFRYSESSGTQVIMEGDSSLRIHTDGTVLYQSGSQPVLKIGSVQEALSVNETVLGTEGLLSSLLGNFSSSAAFYLLELQQSGATSVLRFGYHVDGLPIRFSDGGFAAEVTLEGSEVTKLSLRFRQYTLSDESARLLPLKQALAIAAGHPGAELAVGYADNNGDTVSAQWLLE